MSGAWLKAFALTCLFGAVLLLVEALINWIATNRSEGRAIGQRLRGIGPDRPLGERASLLRRSGDELSRRMPPPLDKVVARIERMMTAARLNISTSRLIAAILLAPILLLLIAVITLLSAGSSLGYGRVLLIATFAGLLGTALPLLALQVKANRTRFKIQTQFPNAVDVFVRGLRAGHPVASALDLLTVEMPEPIRTEFSTVVDEVTYGADLRDALQNMAERWDIGDIRMFVASLSVQSETGGNLAEILENLSQVIRERASMLLKVRALSSEGRMTGIMLTALPILAFTILFVANPKFYLDVSDDPWFVPGFVMLIILYVVGFVSIRRMVDLKV